MRKQGRQRNRLATVLVHVMEEEWMN
jgi:hypothetical protein